VLLAVLCFVAKAAKERADKLAADQAAADGMEIDLYRETAKSISIFNV
jgi:hypothetical protein